MDGAQVLAERIREGCEKVQLESGNGLFNFTVSIGVTPYSEDDEDVSATLNRADMHLYQAEPKDALYSLKISSAFKPRMAGLKDLNCTERPWVFFLI